MDTLTVLVTGVGAPGTYGTIYALKNNPEKRKIKIIGTDINPFAVGQKIVNKFYVCPKANDPKFIDFILNLCKKEKVNIILPQVTKELQIFAENQNKFENCGIKILVSSSESLEIANNKYKLMKVAKKIGIPTPRFYLAKSISKLEKFVYSLGYPDKKVCVKPPISMGTRGFRIISSALISADKFYNNKPDGTFIRLDELLNIFKKDESKYRELIVMEYLPGMEYSVDVLSFNGNAIVVAPRERNTIRSGISFVTTLKENKKIIEYSKKLTEELSLNYLIGYQFKENSEGVPCLIESNPRIQGTMIATVEAGANIIYDAIKISLKEKPVSKQKDIKWDTIIARYWGWEKIDRTE